ncbi:MAG: hypothetical protein WCT03_20765 [Candidatus Obscuribacterales bacterium]|jgi:hypothetical protein
MQQPPAVKYASMSASEIEATITSSSDVILGFSEQLILTLSLEENKRWDIAEDQAKNLLTGSGIGAAILTAILTHLMAQSFVGLKITIAIIVVAALLILAKCAFYSLKALKTMLPKQLTAETIADIQQQTDMKARKQLLAERIWCYKENVALSSAKLYDVFTAKVHATIFVCLSALLGGLVLANSVFSTLISSIANLDYVGIGLAALLFVLAIFSGQMQKQITKIWKFE